MWGDAFIKQVRSDWNIYKKILPYQVPNTRNAELSHRMHYLQMTTEKLGKAALLKSGNNINTICHSHFSFVKFLRTARLNSKVAVRFNMSVKQLTQYVNDLLPLADQIEHLVPSQTNKGVNPEYPWENHLGVVIVPSSYDFQEFKELSLPKGQRLLKFIEIVINDFELIY